MTSERVQRQIDRLLDEAEQALVSRDWERLRDLASDALRLDPNNKDAQAFIEAANRDTAPPPPAAARAAEGGDAAARAATTEIPTAFANGRYIVKRFLG